jgi:hypothetical protein
VRTRTTYLNHFNNFQQHSSAELLFPGECAKVQGGYRIRQLVILNDSRFWSLYHTALSQECAVEQLAVAGALKL